jgi:hypothetical protein
LQLLTGEENLEKTNVHGTLYGGSLEHLEDQKQVAF